MNTGTIRFRPLQGLPIMNDCDVDGRKIFTSEGFRPLQGLPIMNRGIVI